MIFFRRGGREYAAGKGGGAVRVAINAQLVSFGQSYRNAGVSRYTYLLLQGLAARHDDHQTDQQYTAFFNQREAAAVANDPISADGRIEFVPARWPTSNPAQRIAWEQAVLPGELRRRQVAVFHSPVNVLPERLPCASVVTVHDLAFVRYPGYFRPTRRYYQRWFTARSVRQATLIVAVSESTKRDLVEFMRAPEERVHVIYTGIADDFRPTNDPQTLAAFRAAHGLPERYLLFLGTLEPRKNLAGLVEAYARLRALDEQAPPLVIAGAKGWYYDSLFERVRTLGLERNVTFTGYIDRMEQPLWYASAASFIYPSFYEGFGLPIVEALACGTPTVTSNVSSMPEAAGSLAIQVDPNDQDALAHAMRRALSDSALRERTRRDGPLWANHFSIERMAGAYEQVYQQAAQLARQNATI